MADTVRCAMWARDESVDPVGTATKAAGWLLVPWPLPWPRDASDVEALADVSAAAAERSVRLQLVVPAPDADAHEVVLHERPADDEGWFAGYARRSRRVPLGEVGAAALDLLAGGGEPSEGTDVLVCSHGTRDRCCGSFGTALSTRALAAGTSVLRTSHLGGHRFAPTATVLPEGTMWAFLDDALLRRVVDRDGPVEELMPYYRGSSGIPTPKGQAAEREAFADVGWGWLDHRRRAVEDGDGTVQVESVSPTGEAWAWTVEVVESRMLPVPDCGKPLEAAKKSEPELQVRTSSGRQPA